MASSIRKCSMADFKKFVAQTDRFWMGSPGATMHNPMLVTEFGDSAFVWKKNGQIIAYLFGLIGRTTPPNAYVQLVAVREDHRGKGYAKRLYSRFETYARRQGCKNLKAVTSLSNGHSILFHQKFGMKGKYEPKYGGRDFDCIVFTKPL